MEDYGVSLWNAECSRLDYAIGVRETDAKGDLSGASLISIPGGLYAVFETPPATSFDFVNTIHRTWDYIGRVWLKTSGFQRISGPEFETYTEESRSFREKIFIPVRRMEP